MDKEYEMVRVFQKIANQPVAKVPTKIDKDRLIIRANWMVEEIDELRVADNIVDQIDAVLDLLYYALGVLVEIGIPPDEVFEIVHNANLAKIKPNQHILVDENGKVLKPESWLDPKTKIKQYIAIRCNGHGG